MEMKIFQIMKKQDKLILRKLDFMFHQKIQKLYPKYEKLTLKKLDMIGQ